MTFQITDDDDLAVIAAGGYGPGTRAYMADGSATYELGGDGNWNEVGNGDVNNAKMFAVKFTTADETTTSDKTQEEIAAAVEAGKTVFCEYEGAMALYDGENDSATFITIDSTGPTLDNIVIAWSTDAWAITKTSYTLTAAE